MRRLLLGSLVLLVALSGLVASAQDDEAAHIPMRLYGVLSSLYDEGHMPTSFGADVRLRLPDFLFASTATYWTPTGGQVDAGTGLPAVVELVDAFNTYGTKTGTWGTLRADGGSVAWDGGVWVAATGTSPPVQESPTVCPNGPSCGPVAAARTQYVTGATTGQFGWENGVHTPPAGAYSTCVHVALVANDFQTLFAYSESGTGSILWQTQNNTTTVDIYTNGINRRSVALTPGAPHVLCVTCSADQLTGQAYLDGVASGGTFTCTTAAPAQSPRVSGVGNGAYPLNGSLFFGAFHTEAQLSAGDVSSISLATLASQPYGLTSAGAAINLAFTRATASSCDSVADGQASAGSILPAGRPCITRQGIRPAAQVQNLVLRSDEFDNAAWTAVGTPTESANTAVSPWGLRTADTIGDDDATAIEGEQQTLTTSAGQPYTLSVYAKTGTGSELRLSNDGTVCDFTTTADLTRYQCTDTSASGASTVQQILYGNAVGDTGNLILASAQFNAGSFALPYCPTTSAAATCNAESPVFTLPSAIGPSAGIAASVQFFSSAVGTTFIQYLGVAGAGNNMGIYRTNDTAAGYQIGTTSTAPAVTSMGTSWHRSALQDVGGVRSAFFDAVSVAAPAASLSAGQTTLYVGQSYAAGPVNGIVRDVCVQAGGLDGGCRE